MRNPESRAGGVLAWAGIVGVFALGFIFGKATETPETPTEVPPISLIISPSCVSSDNVLTINPNEVIERVSRHALYSQSGGVTIDVDRKHRVFILNCVSTAQDNGGDS